jgi:hypothetical protein
MKIKQAVAALYKIRLATDNVPQNFVQQTE